MHGSRKMRPSWPFTYLLLLAAAAFAAGCSTANNTGGGVAPHPLGNPAWETTPPAAQPHGDAAKATPGSTTGFAYCQICHGAGTNFAGGSSGVSCYTCHGVSAPHAAKPWRASAGSTYTHTTTVETGNAAVCAFCHFPGSPNNPAGHPPTPAPAGTPPGCFNSTLCHNGGGGGGGGGAPHPVPYNDNSHFSVTAATFPANCGTCHAVTGTSPVPAAPLCTTCHIASPLTALNCTSCHANPPSGAAYPNVSGAHATHIALNGAGTPISCNTCHNGLGSGTLNHYNRAKSRVPPGDAAFLATYNAATGASSFDNSAAISCSNVSCHGGQATPNWQTGAINVNTQCTSCHVFGPSVGNPQFNSPYSGRHDINASHRGCTNCHNTTALAVNHFTTLADNTISPAVAAATVGGTGTLITTWTPGAGTSGTCNAACHPGDRSW